MHSAINGKRDAHPPRDAYCPECKTITRGRVCRNHGNSKPLTKAICPGCGELAGTYACFTLRHAPLCQQYQTLYKEFNKKKQQLNIENNTTTNNGMLTKLQQQIPLHQSDAKDFFTTSIIIKDNTTTVKREQPAIQKTQPVQRIQQHVITGHPSNLNIEEKPRNQQLTVSSIYPNRGTTMGGTLVLLEGFFAHLREREVYVFFGDSQANIVAFTPTQICVKTPAYTSGKVNLQVRHLSESFVLKDAFTYEGLPPILNVPPMEKTPLLPSIVVPQTTKKPEQGIRGPIVFSPLITNRDGQELVRMNGNGPLRRLSTYQFSSTIGNPQQGYRTKFPVYVMHNHTLYITIRTTCPYLGKCRLLISRYREGTKEVVNTINLMQNIGRHAKFENGFYEYNLKVTKKTETIYTSGRSKYLLRLSCELENDSSPCGDYFYLFTKKKQKDSETVQESSVGMLVSKVPIMGDSINGAMSEMVKALNKRKSEFEQPPAKRQYREDAGVQSQSTSVNIQPVQRTAFTLDKILNG